MNRRPPKKATTAFDALTTAGLVDAGVLAVGLERGWASKGEVSAYALDRLAAGTDHPDVVVLAAAEEMEIDRFIDILRAWAAREMLPTMAPDQAMRRWMFGWLSAIAESNASPDDKLDRLEEAYAILGHPEEMRECSRYSVSEHERARGIGVGDLTTSPLGAMVDLLTRLGKEFHPL